jgi:xanthine/uracil permease
MEGLQMTDHTKTPSWWPTMLCAAVAMLFVLIAVLGRHQATVPDHTLHGWLPPGIWAYVTVDRLLRTLRQRAGRIPWWIRHPREALALNATVLAALIGYLAYSLLQMASDPFYIALSILLGLLIPVTIHAAVKQWRLRDAETDWPWWDRPFWTWKVEREVK